MPQAPAGPAPEPLPDGWIPAGPSPAAPRTGLGPTFWHLLLAADLALIAWSLAAGLREYGSLEQGLSREALVANTVILLAASAIVPLAWGLGTRREPVRGTLLWFRLEHPVRGIVPGLLLTLALFGGLLVLGLVLVATGEAKPNPVADELIRLVDWRLALFVSAVAGFGEEVLFRGLVQRGLQRAMPAWAAIAAQAVLFGLLHAGYGTLLQLLVPAALGLVFGIVTHRTRNLWPAIYAHFLFDLVQLTSKYWLPPAPA